MVDCREEHVAVKFCSLLRKSAAETILMLKTAYEDTALSKTKVGFNVLILEKSQLKTNPLQDTPQWQE